MNATLPVHNSFLLSWNNISNMIYIDEPIGAGFSIGNDTVNSTETAAPFVWQAFQVLFESGAFSKFVSRELILATDSYGGHYGPAFVTYFNKQNALIESWLLQGERVEVSTLIINKSSVCRLCDKRPRIWPITTGQYSRSNQSILLWSGRVRGARTSLLCSWRLD